MHTTKFWLVSWQFCHNWLQRRWLFVGSGRNTFVEWLRIWQTVKVLASTVALLADHAPHHTISHIVLAKWGTAVVYLQLRNRSAFLSNNWQASRELSVWWQSKSDGCSSKVVCLVWWLAFHVLIIQDGLSEDQSQEVDSSASQSGRQFRGFMLTQDYSSLVKQKSVRQKLLVDTFEWLIQ